jgi:hypothetical protein
MPAAELHLDRDRCRRRSRLAAARGHAAVPVNLYGSASGPPGPAPEARLVSARGTLPADHAEAVRRINALLGDTAKPLSEEQVHLVYLEAGNSNYIRSRRAFLHESTLRNVARAAEDGFALMNSHRTGGLSAPAELPYGRTFAGRYESLVLPGGKPFQRSIVGAYMLRGEYPNGAAGPSTDALKAAIDGGTIFDVSMGLKPGYRAVCDVCAHELGELDPKTGEPACPHVPGTRRAMTDEMQLAQKDRGVDDGTASWSYVNAMPYEVSAVFDGAVPGAGFRKFLSYSRAGLLSASQLSEGRATYGDLIVPPSSAARRPSARAHPLPPTRVQTMTIRDVLARFGIGPDDLTDDVDLDREADDQATDVRPAPQSVPRPARSLELRSAPASEVTAPVPVKPDPAFAQLQAQLADVNRLLEDARREAARAQEERQLAERRTLEAAFATQAEKVAEALKGQDKLTAHQAGLYQPLAARLATDDHDHPVEGYSRVRALGDLLAESTPHSHLKQVVNSRDEPPKDGSLRVLSNDGDGGYDPKAAARAQNDRFIGKGRDAG